MAPIRKSCCKRNELKRSQANLDNIGATHCAATFWKLVGAHLVSLRAATMSVMTEALDRALPLISKYADEGILTRVPGHYVAQASKSLPDPACALEDEMSVEIEAAWVGRVRLTFKKRCYSKPKGQIAYVAWLCHHAEPVADQSSQRAVAAYGELRFEPPPP